VIATTTLVPATTTTTTTTIPAPVAPPAKTGEVGVSIGGVLVDADLQRVNNELVVTVGTAKVVLGALNSDGTRKGLSDSGSLDLESGEAMSVRVEGFASRAEAEFWLFSDPILLEETNANDSGRVAADVEIPDDVEPGGHRFVLSSTNSDGEPVNLSVGINVLPTNGDGIRWEIVLAFLVLGAGGLVALFLPAVLRRRAE
jgi:hypothetical protein